MRLRPPSTPLVACDPYLSIWSGADKLTDENTRHWTGHHHQLTSLIRVDGQTLRLMGADPRHITAMETKSLDVFPTRTVYTFAGCGVKVSLSFTTPAFPHDLDSMSKPLTYISWTVTSTDGADHEVQVFFSASAELAVDTSNQKVNWGRVKLGKVDALRIGSVAQPVLGSFGDNHRIDWGYLYLASTTGQLALVDRHWCWDEFTKSGVLPDVDDITQGKEAHRAPVAAAVLDLGTVGSGTAAAVEVTGHVTVAYDDIQSIEFLGRRLKGYWARNGKTFSQLLVEAEGEYSETVAKCQAYDLEMMADLEAVGGQDYAELASISFRQCIAAHKLVADLDGTPLFFSKENFSNGCIATVDVTYPASPFYLLTNPAFLLGCIKPILDYAELPRWKFPFAPHDLGTYPLANGQVYGGGEATEIDQMPVEECGNMLVLVAAYCKAVGKNDIASKYWNLLIDWANYLKEKGLDPEHQLCTDDFAGHLAHNVNLSLKAIVALGAFAWLAGQLGETKVQAEFRAVAEEFATKWMEMADEGDHYRLTFDGPGTWSQKYNLVWDGLLGLNLFPAEVAAKEIATYLAKQEKYGLPLDSRKTFTKLDWIIWSATLATSQADFEALVKPVWKWANETPDRVPLSDWYETTERGQHYHFQARSVVGGVFIKMLSDSNLWTKWLAKVQG